MGVNYIKMPFRLQKGWKKKISLFFPNDNFAFSIYLASFHCIATRETKIVLVLILLFSQKPRQALTLLHISLLSAPWKGWVPGGGETEEDWCTLPQRGGPREDLPCWMFRGQNQDTNSYKEEPSEGRGGEGHESQGLVNLVLLTRNASGFNPEYWLPSIL